MSASDVTFKRGSLFKPTVTYVAGVDDPADLSAVTITSSVAVAGGARTACVVVKLGGNMSFTCSIVPATTLMWPIGRARWDVKFVYGGVTFYSVTRIINVIENITP